MEFIVGLWNYVLGNIGTDELPNIAVKSLDEGLDTPSLKILAGLGNDVWEINHYLVFTLLEMNIKLPNKTEAGLMLLKYYIQQIIDQTIDPIEGLGKVINKVLMRTSYCEGKKQKYAYEYIGFHKLYGLL